MSIHHFVLASVLVAAIPFVKILITFCVIAVVTALAWWALTSLKVPAPFPTIIIVLGVVVGVLYILDAFGLLDAIR